MKGPVLWELLEERKKGCACGVTQAEWGAVCGVPGVQVTPPVLLGRSGCLWVPGRTPESLHWSIISSSLGLPARRSGPHGQRRWSTSWPGIQQNRAGEEQRLESAAELTWADGARPLCLPGGSAGRRPPWSPLLPLCCPPFPPASQSRLISLSSCGLSLPWRSKSFLT